MKTEDIISTIAHYEHAKGINDSVAGMKGFAAFYIGKLSGAETRLLKRYIAAKQKAAAELVKMYEEEKRG